MSCSSLTKSIVQFIAYIGLPIIIILSLIMTVFHGFGPGTLTEANKWFADIGTWLLAFILFVKPISVLGSKCKLLRPITCGNIQEEWHKTSFEIRQIIGFIVSTIVALSRFFLTIRRPLGVATFYFLFGHGMIAGFQFFSSGASFIDMITNLSFALGILGLMALFIGWITSNNVSIKILKRNWKTIQYLAYLGFMAGAIHAYFFGKEAFLFAGVIWVILKMFEWTIGKQSA